MVGLSKKFLDQYLGEGDSNLSLESEAFPDGITIALLDCEDRSHITIAGKELAAQYRFLSQQLAFMAEPIIAVSPKFIVCWKGRLMVVSADVMAASEPIVSDECFEFRVAMDLMSETLNFCRYNQGGSAGEEQKCSGPPNATAIKGVDGRLYVHNIQGLYPYFPPARGTSVDALVHAVHLRPELVSLLTATASSSSSNSSYPTSKGFQNNSIARTVTVPPLSPGAFVVFGSSDSSSCNGDVRDTAAYLCQHVTSHVAVASLFDSIPDSGAQLVKRLHSFGVNLSCLGILYFAVNDSPQAKKDAASAKKIASLVWTEMCARVMRDILMLDMSHKIESSEVYDSIGEVFSEAAGNFSTYYTETMKPLLFKKFIGLATLCSDKGGLPSPSASLSIGLFVARTLTLIGGQLSKPIALTATTLPTEASAYAVASMDPTTKEISIPPPIHNKTLTFGSFGPTSSPRSPIGLTATASEGLEGRLAVLALSTPAAAKLYLKGRDKQLGGKGLFPELSTVQHSSSYIYSCYDAVRMLNDFQSVATAVASGAGETAAPKGTGSGMLSGYQYNSGGSILRSKIGGASPTTTHTFNVPSSTSPASSPKSPDGDNAADVIAAANEAISIATTALGLVSESPLTGGSPGVVLLRALIKYERATAHSTLLLREGGGGGNGGKQHYASAISDLRIGLKLLAPQVKLNGEDGQTFARGQTSGSSTGAHTPRNPPAGIAPAVPKTDAKGNVILTSSSVYALNIASFYATLASSRGNHEEAHPPFEYAAAACEALYGLTAPQTSQMIAMLADNCLARNDLTAAEQALRDLIAALEATPPTAGSDLNAEDALRHRLALSQPLTTLASILDKKLPNGGASQIHTESDTLHQRNLKLVEDTVGPSHPYLAIAHNNYAANLIRRDKLTRADEELGKAIAILKKVHGTSPSSEVAETLSNIGILRRHQKKMEEAKAYWLEALTNYEAVLPLNRNDAKLLPLLENLATWCREMHNHPEREQYENRIESVKKANAL
eukprot:GILI01010669.1.p1 GENE.GILI01010669.1~~GILI01010669.1.p1  ORF type:complete len:1060 (-),score=198.64 GILI01010669.1:255-3284(-)